MKTAIFNSETEIPADPGVYRFYGANGKVIYVGKAINLRSRLGQYRNAKRIKKHQKMRRILKAAVKLEFESCASPVEAELLEARLIQTLRPKFNLAGAFHFMYPMLGLRFQKGILSLVVATQLDELKGYKFHGAFRSRFLTRQTFDALDELFSMVGHREPWDGKRLKYATVRSYRRFDGEWSEDLEKYLRGEDPAMLEKLILALVEKPSARKRSAEVQEHLRALKRFWRFEARMLYRARDLCKYVEYPVPQAERDPLFIRFRAERALKLRSKKKNPVAKTLLD